MAKVLIEYDTASKTLVATMDGVPVENAREIVFYPSYDRKGDWSMGILQRSVDDANKTCTYTRVEAAVTGEGAAPANTPVPLNPVQRAVSGLFGGE